MAKPSILSKPLNTSGPNATFRRWSMNCTSFNVLIPFLEWRDIMQRRKLIENMYATTEQNALATAAMVEGA